MAFTFSDFGFTYFVPLVTACNVLEVERGETLDYEKAASLLMDDFRSGKLGRITLEFASAAD